MLLPVEPVGVEMEEEVVEGQTEEGLEREEGGLVEVEVGVGVGGGGAHGDQGADANWKCGEGRINERVGRARSLAVGGC